MRYFSVLLLLIVAAPARAQDCCRLEGVVRAADGSPIPGADIMLVLPNAKDPRLSKTDAGGHYVFNDVKPGIRVELRIVAAGRPIADSYVLVTSFVETLDIKVQPETTTPASLDDLSPLGGDSGEVRGTVRAPDGSPIPGAHVAIAGTPVDVVTDSTGRYSFGRLRSKLALNLQATANEYDSATQEAGVPTSGAFDADFELAVSTNAAADVGLGLASSTPDRAQLSVPAGSIASVPSLTPYDVFRGARFLPTAAIGLDESELFVHGSAPDQTYTSLDGMTWYSFPRLAAGLTTPLTTESVQRTDMSGTPGDIEGAGRLGGMVRMSTVRTETSRVTGTGEIGVFGPSGSVTAPIAKIGSVMLAGRHSWPTSLYNSLLDRFAGAGAQYVRDRDVHYTGGVLAISPDSGFSNLNGRFEIAPAKGNRAYVSFFRADDAGNFSRDVLPPAPATSIAPPDPLPLPSDAVLQIGDVQSWTGRGISAVWERRWTADLATTATVARTRFDRSIDQAYDLTSPSNGDLSFVTLRGGSDALVERNDIQDTTVRVIAAVSVGFAHALEVGVEHSSIDTVYNGQSEFAASLVPLLQRTTSGSLASVFAQDVWRPSAKLTVTPGVRIAHHALAASTYIDPRATAAFAAAPHIVVKGSWSIDHQGVNRIVREDLEHGDGVFWTLSDGAVVPVARAQQATGGVTLEMPGLLFDAHGYYRMLDGLSLFAPRLLPGAALVSPNQAFYTGTGKASGLELLVQHRTDRNTIWASYAGGRVEYSYPALLAGTFPASFDRLHQVKLTDTARVIGPLTVTAVFLAGSGAPYTPSTGSQQVWFASGVLAYAPAFDAKNSSRLPGYNQLDVSGQISHRFGAVTTAVGVIVFNVYDRQNVAYYDFEAAGPAAITSQTELMRRAGDVFFRVGF
jgi:hypothetical protein